MSFALARKYKQWTGYLMVSGRYTTNIRHARGFDTRKEANAKRKKFERVIDISAAPPDAAPRCGEGAASGGLPD